jgi:hypothetical protein
MAMTPVTLTADKKIPKLSDVKYLEVPMPASTTIYMGTLVGVTMSTGYAVKLADAVGNAATAIILGIADEQKTSVAAGATKIRVATCGIFRLAMDAGATMALTMLGGKMVAAGDGNITTATLATNDNPVGMVVGVPDVSVYEVDVYIEPGANQGNTT